MYLSFKMQTSHSGILISFEGGEGSGKTRNLLDLYKSLEEKGLNVIRIREPGGTSIGEQIRDVIHSLTNIKMNPRTETLLYQAARAQIVEETLKPHLDRGMIFLMDRFFDSTLAYQGYGHQQNLEELKYLIKYATGGLTPDMTILFDVKAEIGLKRRSLASEWNRLDAMPLDFHMRVNQGYRELAALNPDRWRIIDANQSYVDAHRDLENVVETFLINRGLIEGNSHGKERI